MAEINTQSVLILNEIMEGGRDFLSLDFSNPIEREVALECIKNKEEYSYLLDTKNKDQKNILIEFISLSKIREIKYNRIFRLLRKQLDKDILDIYFAEKFEEEKDKFADNLDVYRGFTSSLILSYDYETKEGETLCYFDKALGVPTKLRVIANFKLKLIDSLSLVKALDIAISSISLDNVLNLINNQINTLLRDTILPIIEDNSLSYFDLSRNYTMLGQSIVKNSEEILGKSGIEVSDLCIKDIAISNNAGKMLEEQYFAIAEAERIKEFENRLEEASLNLYEKKAIIHQKYPTFPVTLTEAEKDFAFDRYLRKENKGKIYSTKLDDVKLEYRSKPEKIVKSKPELIVPKEPFAPKTFKGLVPYSILFALFLIASLVAMFVLENKQIGLFALIGSAVVFGVIGIVIYAISAKNKKLYPSKKEYKKLYEEYQKELEIYQEKKDEENSQEQ